MSEYLSYNQDIKSQVLHSPNFDFVEITILYTLKLKVKGWYVEHGYVKDQELSLFLVYSLTVLLKPSLIYSLAD